MIFFDKEVLLYKLTRNLTKTSFFFSFFFWGGGGGVKNGGRVSVRA